MSDAAVETVLHEQRARTGTRTVPVRTAVLQRVVVRETRTVEIEVAHEEFRVVYRDVDESVAEPTATRPPAPVSVVLHEERYEVVRRVVPVERVTMRVVPVEGEAQVEVALAHEEADVERP